VISSALLTLVPEVLFSVNSCRVVGVIVLRLALLAAWVRRVAEWVLACGNVGYRGKRQRFQRQGKARVRALAPGLSGWHNAGVAARYRVVEATVFAPQLGERRLAQPILCALEEANDLVFFGAAAA